MVGLLSSPCKNCKDRYVKETETGIPRCHSNCPKYVAFREARDNELHEKSIINQKYYDITDFKNRIIRREIKNGSR